MTDAVDVVIVQPSPLDPTPDPTPKPTPDPVPDPAPDPAPIPPASGYNVGEGGDVGVTQTPTETGGFITAIDPTAGGTVSPDDTTLIGTFMAAVVGLFLFIIKILLGGGILKFIVFLVVSAIVTLLYKVLPTLIPEQFKTFSSVDQAFNVLPDGAHYFLGMFAVDVGIPMLIAAYIARFLIRRIPFIG